MRRVDVALSEGRGYGIVLAPGGLESAGEWLQSIARGERVVVLTDRRVAVRWATPLSESLVQAGFQTDTIAFAGGETRKSLTTIAALYGQLYNLSGIDRRTLLVALGGGVVGDMVGFVAATYLRGLDYVQVPTTLLAMVDSSVGGKTGVDFREGKNLVGAFHQPRGVLIDPGTLSTLSRRELRSGMAEVVKYGVIRDPQLLETLQARGEGLFRDPEALAEIAARSCQIKAEVVTADEREETGLRAILNFGHTIGHALEGATGYRRYKHGEAIAIGMVSAACIGEAAGVTPPAVRSTLTGALRALKLPVALPSDIDDETLIALTARDKKAVAGEARFVLANELGRVETRRVPLEAVCQGLRCHRATERS